MGGPIDEFFGAGTSQLVANLITRDSDLVPQLQVLRQIVTGQIDADRTDYLLRDSHHCGVDYGRFDYQRLIESLNLVEDELGFPDLALERGGLHAFEALILARYQMNTQVYYHRLRQLYDHYLVEYFKAAGYDEPPALEDALRQDDVGVTAQMARDSADLLTNRGSWARRIMERDHHWLVHETGASTNAIDLKRSRRVLNVLEKSFPGIGFLHLTADANIHKLLRPDDASEEGLVRFSVISRDGTARQVGEESQILGYVPRKYQCARIFADSPRSNKAQRIEITEQAAKAWMEGG